MPSSRSTSLIVAPARNAPRIASSPNSDASTMKSARSRNAERTRISAVVSCSRTSVDERRMERCRPRIASATATTKTPNAIRSASFEPSPPDSPEKKSDSRTIGVTSAIDAPATTTCPNGVAVSPESLRIGRITPSPVAERMIATSSGDLTRPPVAPKFSLGYVARHAIDFWLTSEDLPRPDNRVLVDREGRIHPHYTDANTERHKRLVAKRKALLPALGCHPTLIPNQAIRDERIPVAGRGASVRNDSLRKRPCDVGPSTSTARRTTWTTCTSSTRASSRRRALSTPALTAMANALRVGDHLIERLSATRDSRPAEEAMVS
jgi:hypothetical protein